MSIFKRIFIYVFLVIIILFCIYYYLNKNRINDIEVEISKLVGKTYFKEFEKIGYKSEYYGPAGTREIFIYIKKGSPQKLKERTFIKLAGRTFLIKTFDNYLIVELLIN